LDPDTQMADKVYVNGKLNNVVEDPSLNEEGGFWRIAYRGSDPNPVANWETLVQPGDIVRMGWVGGGFHTLTVTAAENAAGQIRVVDNIGPADAYGNSTIAEHWVDYGSSTKTDPASITIYRLSPDQRYLIDDTTSTADDNIIGTVFNDDIRAGSGNDTLNGGKGNDLLTAGLGVDSLYGGDGNDTLVETYKYNPFAFDYLDGGAGTNTVDFSHYQDAVRIDLSAGAAWTTDSTNLASGTLRKVATLVSIDNVVGGAGNDEIRGDNNDNILDGGRGDDTIYAGVGNDTVHGGQDNDTLSFAGINSDLTLDLAAGKATYVDGGTLYDASGNPVGGFAGLYTVTWDGIENLTGGSGDDVLTGDKNDNKLDGGPGTDTAVFHGTRSEYTITTLANGDLQVADSVGTCNSPTGRSTRRACRPAATSTMSSTSTAAIRRRISAPAMTPSMSITATGPIRFTSPSPAPM
jgi:Ca2+-binding RTX toxin-like protein